MAFPSITSCIVCDATREETRGKLTLLGFSGVAPDVSLKITDISKPVTITFVLTAGAGVGTFGMSFVLVDPTGKNITETPPESVDLNPQVKGTMVAVSFIHTYAKPGRYGFGMTIDGKRHYQTTFELTT